MKFYRFKTFTTSYYFPRLDAGHQYMYGLYSPYGGVFRRYTGGCSATFGQ